MRITQVGTDTCVSDFGSINLPLTLDCGQCFRWKALPDGSFYGIASKKETRVKEQNGTLIFYDTDKKDVEKLWLDYFDLFTDYDGILDALSEDKILREAIAKYGTIRILNQDPWEALCSFIISACNNIPRIRSITERFALTLGDPLINGYAFPDAGVVAQKTPDELGFLRAGYRVPYIIDAATKVANGEIDFDKIKNMPPDEARKALMDVKGVGRKVADCTLLFSLRFFDVYPVDRHIARANEALYPDGLPSCFDGNRGLAQQYIFHMQRTSG